MISIDNAVLSVLQPDARAQLEEAVAVLTVLTPALIYKPLDHSVSPTASRIGGQPCTRSFDWPLDKNRKPMVFWAQLNFETLNSTINQCPNRGMVMLFVSEDYTSFRAKDQSWFKIIYWADVNAVPLAEQLSGSASLAKPVVPLVPELIEHVFSCEEKRLLEKLSLSDSFSQSARELVLTWFQSACQEGRERLRAAHLVCCSDFEQSNEACEIAAFHANGITFDQTRRADRHYKHLVDSASEWRVLWKLGGLEDIIPDEKRQLFVCIQRKDILELDFSKCSAVFL